MGAAAVVETTGVRQVAKRIRRMTPLERTRFLVRVIPEGEGPPVPGRPVPSFVVLDDGALPPAVPPYSFDDPVLCLNRRRVRVLAGVYAMERWLAGRDVPAVLFELVPAFCEVAAVAGDWERDAYDATIGGLWDGTLFDAWSDPPAPVPSHFTTICERVERIGGDHPKPDLPAEGEIDVELELHRLTGAYGLDLTDEQAVDALNAAENHPDGPAAGLASYLTGIGREPQWPGI